MQGNVKLMRSYGMLAAWNIHVEQVVTSVRVTTAAIENDTDSGRDSTTAVPRNFVSIVVVALSDSNLVPAACTGWYRPVPAERFFAHPC